MTNVNLSHGEAHSIKCQLAGEVLRSFGKLRLQVQGWSMLPSIYPGDTLVIERARGHEVTEGDIVLFSRDKRLFAHRVTRKTNGDLAIQTRGDAMIAADPEVPESELLGRVSFIIRKGTCFVPRQTLRSRDRAVAALVRRSQLAARLVVGIHGFRTASSTQNFDRALHLPELIAEIEPLSLVIEIGEMPVRIRTVDSSFLAMLENRYAGYVSNAEHAEIEFDIDLHPNWPADPNADVRVCQFGGRWTLQRGDFRAQWEPSTRRGWIRQTANPYSIDALLRIVHTLMLAKQGGFLLHSASAIRNGKAFLFAGVSEAGKTTISRLAPPDVTLLTDEISYVRRQNGRYIAFGTPFTGELAKLGENASAPVEALYLLAKGRENRIDPMEPGEAVRSLLANLLFFAEDEEFVRAAFHSAFEFVSRVPVSRLTFVPDARVWELIG